MRNERKTLMCWPFIPHSKMTQMPLKLSPNAKGTLNAIEHRNLPLKYFKFRKILRKLAMSTKSHGNEVLKMTWSITLR